MWRKVKGGLSAGRVQSVAVRLIVEKERDIEKFTQTASYRVDGAFTNSTGKNFKAKLAKNFTTKKEAENFLNSCIDAQFSIASLEKKPAKKIADGTPYHIYFTAGSF